MDETLERNLGEQPIARILKDLHLKPHDVVAASEENITHKMVTKACKGRRLTENVQGKIIRAMNRILENSYSKKDLFNY
tara:strand:+ start:209 stop:445 length:237 start_codon:yes stop_codon:yes gene_type:complete